MFWDLVQRFSHYGKGWQTFSAKGQIVNSLDFTGHMSSSQLLNSHHSSKAATDNTKSNNYDWVPINLIYNSRLRTGFVPRVIVCKLLLLQEA